MINIIAFDVFVLFYYYTIRILLFRYRTLSNITEGKFVTDVFHKVHLDNKKLEIMEIHNKEDEYIPAHWYSGRVFVISPGDLGSIPGRVHSKNDTSYHLT